MSNTLPIDIPYQKAADWLVERRVVGSSWQKALRTAHSKLEAALEAERPGADGAAAIIPAGRSRQSTTYFECAALLELLKSSKGYDEKSFLGAYTNEHTARWADVVKRFESGSVFLVDSAQFLVHSCAYELPALKQEISRAEKELAELSRRQSEYTRLAEASQVRFVEACAKRRIPSTEEDAEGLRTQLEASRAQLRPLYEQVARRVQAAPLPAALREYRAFLANALDKLEAVAPPAADKGGGAGKKGAGKKSKAEGAAVVAVAASGGAEGDAAALLLPMLARVQELDLSSLSAADAFSSSGGGGASAETGAGAAVEIDWGGGGGGSSADDGGGAAAAVDWGIEAEDGGAENPDGAEIEVDWGMLGGGGDGAGGGGGAADSSYDFEIELEDSGEGGGGSEEELGLISIFEGGETRAQLLDDLFELQAFLTQWEADLSASSAASASTLPSELQLDKAEVRRRLDAVNEAIETLDNEHTRHLLLLGTSSRYLDRQVSLLRQMLDSSEKMRLRAEEMQTRQAELSLTIQGAFPRYEAAVSAIKTAKDQFEAALSKHFDGRRINLMGDINSL